MLLQNECIADLYFSPYLNLMGCSVSRSVGYRGEVCGMAACSNREKCIDCTMCKSWFSLSPCWRCISCTLSMAAATFVM